MASSPEKAAADAELVTSMLRDDDASRAAWCDETTGALGALPPDAIGIECSTLGLS